MPTRLFDRTAAQPQPVKIISASQPKRKPGRPKGAMPKRFLVACYRTSFATRQSELLYEKRFAYFSSAAKVLANLVMRYTGDSDSAVEFVFDDTLPTEGGAK